MKFSTIALLVLTQLTLLTSCVGNASHNHQRRQGDVHVYTRGELLQRGWKLPLGQDITTKVPPLPGTVIYGQTVPLSSQGDTPWTAFTLVLFRDNLGKIFVLTQKRAVPPVGVIETMGGHLTSGQSWGKGATTELEQEAGLSLSEKDLLYVQGGTPRVSVNNKLSGNANFVVMFKGATPPQTSENCHEIDQNYGHKWIDIDTLYNEVKQEEALFGYNHNKYSSYFRKHLIFFYENVLK